MIGCARQMASSGSVGQTVVPSAASAATVFVFLLLYLAWFPDTIQVFHLLNSTWFDLITDQDPRVLVEEIATPGAGEHVLPPRAREGLALLRSNGTSRFSISPPAFQDIELRQRLIEGAYPIRYAENAEFILQLAGEPLATGCSRVAAQGGMALVHCP